MNRHQIRQMADFQPSPKEKSRWWQWLVIIGVGALLGWLLITACADQQNPRPPPKVKQMRAVA